MEPNIESFDIAQRTKPICNQPFSLRQALEDGSCMHPVLQAMLRHGNSHHWYVCVCVCVWCGRVYRNGNRYNQTPHPANHTSQYSLVCINNCGKSCCVFIRKIHQESNFSCTLNFKICKCHDAMLLGQHSESCLPTWESFVVTTRIQGALGVDGTGRSKFSYQVTKSLHLQFQCNNR